MNLNTKRHYLLSFALLIPICAWLVQLCLSYALGSYFCGRKMIWLFHSISFFCLLIALFGVILGRKVYHLSERKTLSQGVLGLGVIFSFIIVVSDFANFMLEPCQ